MTNLLTNPPFRPATLVAPLVAAVALASCGPASQVETETADAAESPLENREPAPTQEALAILEPTEGSQVSGTVRFETMEIGGVRVTADVSGLAPGAHAYHVHTYGDCTASDGSSAGPHFRMVPEKEGAETDFITGNLGELEAGEDGTARATREVPIAELNGPFALPGRAVVVHERGNDPSAAPSGDTGARVACGVIGVAGTE